MNPFQSYQFTQLRDKTKSYFEPASTNHFTNSHVYQQQNQKLIQISSSPISQIDKYKSYYIQYQDYRRQNVSQLSNQYSSRSINDVQPRSSKYDDKFNTALPNNFYPSLDQTKSQNSQQRQRFYTVTQNQKNKNPFSNVQQQKDTFSSSMIFLNQNSSKLKQQIDLKKDLYKFVNQKFAGSRFQSQYNSRQKKNQSHSSNKTEYLQKANKKISLKRDIAPISPKYHENLNIFPSTHSNFINEVNDNKTQQARAFYQKSFSFIKPSKSKEINEIQQKKQIHQQFILSSTLDRFSPSLDNSSINKNTITEEKQISFKKSNKTILNTFNAEKTTPSNHSSTTPNGQSNSQKQQFFGSIRSNNPLTSGNLPPKSSSSNQLIDSQVYADMKISRIQETTLNMQQKIQSLTKNLQILVHHSKEHQTSINEINQYITKQQEQGMTPHDIKRIKKQLKIMKTNFETAFTSMTDQINRKLIKQENIMKSLSDQIKMVAEENQKLTQTFQQKNKKVDSLQKSMTSFMRQNQERMQNLVLNESFSSSKRSKNHSFQYGLDLKNMSSDENYNSGKQNQSFDSLNKRLDNIERQIKKMKIFHIEEQESYQVKFAEIKKQIQKGINQQSKIVNKSQITQMIRQLSEQILTLKLENFNQVQNQKDQKRQDQLAQQLKGIKLKIEELSKIYHQELYDFRMNKLQNIQIPNFVTQSKIQTMNSQFEHQLNEVQSKQRSMLLTLTEYQQKLISFQERQHNMWKNFEDNKLRQLKQSGDIRQVQTMIKEINQQICGFVSQKSASELILKQMSSSILMVKNSASVLQMRINEIDRINGIQTQNIESINNEFERVINREIIPKFGQIHQLNMQTNQRINVMVNDINMLKRIGQEENRGNKNAQINNANMSNTRNKNIEMSEIQKKIEQYFGFNVQKFINKRVKLISTKLISSRSPLSKIGLFTNKNNNQNNSVIKSSDIFAKSNSFLKGNNKYEQQQCQQNEQQLNGPIIEKQNVYLIDQDNYLMDWCGVYLMQSDDKGLRHRIRITEQQIYYMQVNGLQIISTNTNNISSNANNISSNTKNL